MGIWVKLYRLRTDSWLETHIDIPIHNDVKDELEDIILTDWPGWQLISFATPEFQDENGQPLEF